MSTCLVHFWFKCSLSIFYRPALSLKYFNKFINLKPFYCLINALRLFSSALFSSVCGKDMRNPLWHPNLNQLLNNINGTSSVHPDYSFLQEIPNWTVCNVYYFHPIHLCVPLIVQTPLIATIANQKYILGVTRYLFILQGLDSKILFFGMTSSYLWIYSQDIITEARCCYFNPLSTMHNHVGNTTAYL